MSLTGDFKGQVDGVKINGVIGGFGIQRVNENEELMLEICEQNEAAASKSFLIRKINIRGPAYEKKLLLNG